MSVATGGKVRFSYCMLPDYPLVDSIEMIKVADELGYYACYSVDETWHKDLWCLFSAAADKTERIRFGPDGALPPAGHSRLGHGADRREPLGAPRLDA